MRRLETHRMILRDWELSDLYDFSEIWTNPNVTIPEGDLPLSNKDDCLPMLHYLISAQNNYALELKATSKVIGSVGLNEESDNNPNGRNLGYSLNETYWNNGYMQEALREIIKNAHEITSFLSIVFPNNSNNVKSQHIVKKLGFKFVKDIDGGTNKLGEHIACYQYYVLELSNYTD